MKKGWCKRQVALLLAVVLCLTAIPVSAGSYDARCALGRPQNDWIVNFGGTSTGYAQGISAHQLVISGTFRSGGILSIWQDTRKTVVADTITAYGTVNLTVTEELEQFRVYRPLSAEALKQAWLEDANSYRAGKPFTLSELDVLYEGTTPYVPIKLTETGYYFVEGKLPGGDMSRAMLIHLEPPQVVGTRYQSTAELTAAYIADLDYNDFHVTITNPTDTHDSGTIALVLASHMATVNFIDYELGPHESVTKSVSITGHMGSTTREMVELLQGGWGQYLNADIITFSSDEDLASYRDAVPYEQDTNTYGHSIQQGHEAVREWMVVCYGKAGDAWLRQYTGIGRKSQPSVIPGTVHDSCK